MDRNPTVGLLNIGTEETKGNELIKESYKLLKRKSRGIKYKLCWQCRGKRCVLWAIRYTNYRWIYRKYIF